jgi:hypothetical protein
MPDTLYLIPGPWRGDWPWPPARAAPPGSTTKPMAGAMPASTLWSLCLKETKPLNSSLRVKAKAPTPTASSSSHSQSETALRPRQSPRCSPQLRATLNAGKNVAIHCRQGIGRSGIIVAALLLTSGVNLNQAIDTVSRARGQAIPETPEQLRWLQRLATDPRVAGRESDTETPQPPSSMPPESPSPASRRGRSERAAPGRVPI